MTTQFDGPADRPTVRRRPDPSTNWIVSRRVVEEKKIAGINGPLINWILRRSVGRRSKTKAWRAPSVHNVMTPDALTDANKGRFNSIHARICSGRGLTGSITFPRSVRKFLSCLTN